MFRGLGRNICLHFYHAHIGIKTDAISPDGLRMHMCSGLTLFADILNQLQALSNRLVKHWFMFMS